MRLPLLMAPLLLLPLFGALPAAADDSDCFTLGTIRSEKSDTPTQIVFVNKTPQQRTILWIDFTGATKQYAALQPGQTLTQRTYLTHPWMVTDGPGNCYGIFMPRAGTRTVLLTDYGRGGGD